MNILRHLGYPEEAGDALSQTADDYARPYSWFFDQRVTCCQLPCGAQLWLEWNDEQQTYADFEAHFTSPNAMYLEVEKIWRFRDSVQPLRSKITAGVRAGKKDPFILFNNVFDSPNLCAFKELAEGDSLVAQVAAFPITLHCYESVDAYRLTRQVKFAEESFASGLVLTDGEDPDPPATGMMTGIVQSARCLVNDVTGLAFYHLAVRCRGVVFDVCAAPDLFPELPKPGAVVQGTWRFTARVLDYGFTGYVFDIDVKTPLTADRFEPIRGALCALQPGEKVHCQLVREMDGIRYVRAKGEIEGTSVEFGTAAEDGSLRILRFYPIAREEGIRLFRRVLVHEDPPELSDAKDVTSEYS